MRNLTLMTVGLTLFTAQGAFADRKWNDTNNPANMESNYVYSFSRLPTSGDIGVSSKGWSDSYWPATRGYLADRWQIPGAAFGFKKYTLAPSYRLFSMGEGELNTYSPAEKFEMARGHFDFPFMKKLQEDNPKDKDWWKGVCNGWTRASLNIPEPHSIVYTTDQGLKIPFGSSDIKGLLAYYYAVISHSNTKYVGEACRLAHPAGCGRQDLHAAAFHVVVANELGLRHAGFAMDWDPTVQTWNQPFIGYKSKVTEEKTSDLSKDKTEGTVKEVYVTTTLTYVNELYDTTVEDNENDVHVAPSFDAQGPGKQHTREVTYQYVLELNAYGNIIGGEWEGDGSHPDLIWKEPVDLSAMATETSNYKDNWTELAKIVKQATAYATESQKP